MNIDLTNRPLSYFVSASVIAISVSMTWFFASGNEADKLNVNHTIDKAILPPSLTNNSDLSSVEQQLNHMNQTVGYIQDQLNEQVRSLVEQNEKIVLELSTLKQKQNEPLNHEVALLQAPDISIVERVDPDKQQEQERAMAEQWHEEQFNYLESHLAGQTEDQSWSMQVEMDFHGAFDNNSEHYTLNDISCGDTMCRLEASMQSESEDSTPRPGLDHVIHGEAGWAGQSMFELDTETGNVTVYLMRDGVDMPMASIASGYN